MMRNAIFAVVLVATGSLAGCETLPDGRDAPREERAVAEIVLASVGAEAIDTPDEQLGECGQCQGTGTVGDGRTATKCMKCGGDGRIDERDLRQGATPAVGAGLSDGGEAATAAGSVTLHITDVTKRGWPEQWWMDEKPVLEADGWSVSIEKHAIDEQQAAHIEVCAGDRCWSFFAPVTAAQLRHLKDSP